MQTALAKDQMTPVGGPCTAVSKRRSCALYKSSALQLSVLDVVPRRADDALKLKFQLLPLPRQR